MTDDATVIRKLAERLGWKPAGGGFGGFSKDHGSDEDGWTSTSFRTEKDMGLFLRSRDALAPILAGLSGKERWELHKNLLCAWMTLPMSKRPPNYTEWLLTLSPRDLAYAIAEALTPTIRPTPENTLQKNP
jgi:hypothetical protein